MGNKITRWILNQRLSQKLLFHFTNWWNGIKLLSKQDLRKFFQIDQKIHFLSDRQIKKKQIKGELRFISFQWCEELKYFYQYYDEIIVLNFLNWQQKIKFFDKKYCYLLLGPWRKQMEYYRYLKFHNYQVYLYKSVNDEKSKTH